MLGHAGSAFSAPKPAAFNLPAGEATATLKQFAAQADVQIVYMVHNVRGEKTNPVSGTFTARAALEHMLEGTRLVVSEDLANGALVVGRRKSWIRRVLKPRAKAAVPLRGDSQRTDAAPDAETDDGIVRLSSFEVSADEDRGYQASNTVAGTRLRSSLKDLAASISVVTRDFIDDVNATDLTSLLVYTLGTEVGGYGGNFSDLTNPEAAGVFDDALGQASPGTRIRGLIQADRTRNYFLTDVPLDTYNVERIEVSRGANANLFGLGSPAGIINANMITANLRQSSTAVTASYGSYRSHRGTLDHNHVMSPDRFALRVAAMIDDTRYRAELTGTRKKGVTLTGTYQPSDDTTIRLTTELGRTSSNRPQQRPPFDRYSWWWAAGRPVWDPAAPAGGAGRLLGVPTAPFTSMTVFAADGTRQRQNYFTSNWGGSAANIPLLAYLDPNSSALGGLAIGGGVIVDGVKGFADNSALSADGTMLVPSGMLGLNSRVFIEQNVHQASNPLRTLFNREPMISDPGVFDFYHEVLGGPTKYEYGWWEAHNLTIEQTFLDGGAGIEMALDRQRLDNGFTSPINYAINLDPNERLPNGAPNPNFLRPVTIGGGFKRIYSQDRDAARVTAYYELDLRSIRGPEWLSTWLGRHLLNANYARQDSLYQQFGGSNWNNGLDWREYESQIGPGSTSSTARIVSLLHYLGPSVADAPAPDGITMQGLRAVQDPSGVPTMTLLTHQRPISNAPAELKPWAPATFSLVSNGRHDVRNTIRNAQRYSDRLEQQVRSLSVAAQGHWLGGNLVSTVGWRRDHVRGFDAGIPGVTPLGTADVRWDVFYPRLTRSLSESSSNWGVVGHLPAGFWRKLPGNTEVSAFYNTATNFRIAPQRYTITGVSLPSETGGTREYGVRVVTWNGRIDFRAARYETRADNATVSGFTSGLNQLAMMVPQVIDHNYLGDNVDNPEGVAEFEAWLESPYGEIYRRAFSATLSANEDPGRPASYYGHYASATGDRGQIAGVSALKSTGYEFELIFNPTRQWRIAANAAAGEAVRAAIAPELRDFLFNPDGGILSLVQNRDGSPSAAGRLIGTPFGTGAAPLHSFVLGNVINLGIVSTFAQEGTRTDELRKWSFRAITNYSFSDEIAGGHLRGFSVGGAVRWSGAPVLGYAGTTIASGGSTLAVSDVTRPYLGASEAIWDGWIGYTRTLRPGVDWKLQLNVRNIGVGNELRPLAAWPDGTIIQWTIKEAQRWTLTSTFTF